MKYNELSIGDECPVDGCKDRLYAADWAGSLICITHGLIVGRNGEPITGERIYIAPEIDGEGYVVWYDGEEYPANTASGALKALAGYINDEDIDSRYD